MWSGNIKYCECCCFPTPIPSKLRIFRRIFTVLLLFAVVNLEWKHYEYVLFLPHTNFKQFVFFFFIVDVFMFLA